MPINLQLIKICKKILFNQLIISFCHFMAKIIFIRFLISDILRETGNILHRIKESPGFGFIQYSLEYSLFRANLPYFRPVVELSENINWMWNKKY
jgi:hypothetical protein